MNKFVVVAPIYPGSGRPGGFMKAVPESQFDWQGEYHMQRLIVIEAANAAEAIASVWEDYVYVDAEGLDQWR